MLRVIARSMVLWDTVQASGRWIQEQIPAVVRQSFREMFCLAEDRAGLGGTRRGKDKNRKVDDPLLFGEDNGEMDLENTNSPHTEPGIGRDVDKQAVRQMYCYTIAGACFAIGLRFAGTADKDAAATIQDRILLLHSFREGDNLVYLALRPDPTIVELCLGLCAISLGIVMAGSGDLDSLRLLKLIRWRCEDDTKYGTHMSIGAAIGLLFLGGGMSTLGRSNQDVAALVMAFFPRFPATASENSFHLQALRHFYALAVKRRDIRAINVDTSEQVCVQAEVRIENARPSTLVSYIRLWMEMRRTCMVAALPFTDSPFCFAIVVCPSCSYCTKLARFGCGAFQKGPDTLFGYQYRSLPAWPQD